MRSEVPCCAAPKGGPVFRDRNGRCGLLQNSHLGGFAARCALRAALRRARGRPRSPNASAPAGAKAFLLGGFSFPSAFEMRKEKPRFRPPYGSFCPIGGCLARKNKSAWLLFRVLFFAGGDTPRKKSTRSAPRAPRQRSIPRGVKRGKRPPCLHAAKPLSRRAVPACRCNRKEGTPRPPSPGHVPPKPPPCGASGCISPPTV